MQIIDNRLSVKKIYKYRSITNISHINISIVNFLIFVGHLNVCLLIVVCFFGIGIGDTGPVFIWYRIDTKLCSVAHPYTVHARESLKSYVIG